MPGVTPRHATTPSRGLKPLYLIVVAIALFVIAVWLHRDPQAIPRTVQTQNHSVKTPDFNKQQYSLSDPASPWVVINKQHPLDPVNFVPAQLVIPNVPLKDSRGAANMQVSESMASALEQMFAGAADQGLHLMLSSGYRSYAYQVRVYNSIVKSQGQGSADEQSARPGYSEHQTGLAADIAPTSRKCDLKQCFGQTPEGQWLAANAYRYGFIVRYTAAKQAVTGYEDEPWHLRYVGPDLADEMHKQDVSTLEEFFNVPGGTTYR
jgi:D-alanyl-D-alanine carboxypeptidase